MIHITHYIPSAQHIFVSYGTFDILLATGIAGETRPASTQTGGRHFSKGINLSSLGGHVDLDLKLIKFMWNQSYL